MANRKGAWEKAILPREEQEERTSGSKGEKRKPTHTSRKTEPSKPKPIRRNARTASPERAVSPLVVRRTKGKRLDSGSASEGGQGLASKHNEETTVEPYDPSDPGYSRNNLPRTPGRATENEYDVPICHSPIDNETIRPTVETAEALLKEQLQELNNRMDNLEEHTEVYKNLYTLAANEIRALRRQITEQVQTSLEATNKMVQTLIEEVRRVQPGQIVGPERTNQGTSTDDLLVEQPRAREVGRRHERRTSRERGSPEARSRFRGTRRPYITPRRFPREHWNNSRERANLERRRQEDSADRVRVRSPIRRRSPVDHQEPRRITPVESAPRQPEDGYSHTHRTPSVSTLTSINTTTTWTPPEEPQKTRTVDIVHVDFFRDKDLWTGRLSSIRIILAQSTPLQTVLERINEGCKVGTKPWSKTAYSAWKQRALETRRIGLYAIQKDKWPEQTLATATADIGTGPDKNQREGIEILLNDPSMTYIEQEGQIGTQLLRVNIVMSGPNKPSVQGSAAAENFLNKLSANPQNPTFEACCKELEDLLNGVHHVE